jgi:hypothetical protein
MCKRAMNTSKGLLKPKSTNSPILHPSKFLIPEEEDDGREGGGRMAAAAAVSQAAAAVSQ